MNMMIPESSLANLKEMGYAGVEVIITPELMTATFNFVPFIGLIFATRAISFKNKMKAMGIGLPIIVIAHIFFLVYKSLNLSRIRTLESLMLLKPCSQCN